MINKESLNKKSLFGNLKKRKSISFIFFLFMLFLFTNPLNGTAITNVTNGIEVIDPITNPSYSLEAIPLINSRTFRIAIYNEPNATVPTYATDPGTSHNNVTTLVNILSVNEFIDISILTAEDIFNHELTTANFDVLALIDNFPREYIVDMVMDFWLAGGGIISFDGSIEFLNYFGMLPPEALGTSGYFNYWYFGTDGFKIINRHPISKAYELDTIIASDAGYYYSAWDWSVLATSSVAGAFTPIAESITDSNMITALAFDPYNRGGKIVTIGYDLDHELVPDLDQMIRDTVDWLTPRPKARIAFDMSHKPRRSIDPWDTYSSYPNSYVIMRDLMVSRGYTFDKLYGVPSGDNFTIDRLSKYDMLICLNPDLNYTAGDRAAVEAWVTDGGSILAVSDNPTASFVIGGDQINQLMAPFGMSVQTGYSSTTTFTDYVVHPTSEGVTSLYYNNYGYINITGSAEPLWIDGPYYNIVAAANNHGLGRAVYTTDINWFQDSYIINADNQQYIINLVNWLTAATADVLMYVDWSPTNYYRSPLALALNDLGINFYLTGGFGSPAHEYFNYSLTHFSWDCVIIDAPNYFGLENYLDEIENYVDAGGMLIMSAFDIDSASTHTLWTKLGFEYASTFADEPVVYIWDSGHPIFNQPVDYNAANFSIGTSFGDDGDKLTVLANGIPLAGTTATETADEAIIILRNDEQTLYNGYLIDEYTDDIDDSAYTDNFELWKNEIAFMMRPKLEYVLTIPAEASTIDTIEVVVNITNYGLSDATLGFIDITIPVDLGTTTDDVSDIFDIPKGGTHAAIWNIAIAKVGDYTIGFESSYQGYIGTSYSELLTFDISIQLLPMYLWIIIGAGGGALLLLILIISIAASVKKKKKTPTR